MKGIRHFFQLSCMAMLMSVIMISCSENNDEYNSKLPVYSDIEFTPDVIRVGQTIQATAVRKSKGKYLYEGTYTWSITGVEGTVDMTPNYSSVTDPTKEKENPSVTFIAPSYPGTFTITLNATYKVSGNGKQYSQDYDISKGHVSGFISAFSGNSIVTKTFTVVR